LPLISTPIRPHPEPVEAGRRDTVALLGCGRKSAPLTQESVTGRRNPFRSAELPLSLGRRHQEPAMFDALRSLFAKPDATLLSMEPKLAVAALLVHLAAVDGSTKPEER